MVGDTIFLPDALRKLLDLVSCRACILALPTYSHCTQGCQTVSPDDGVQSVGGSIKRFGIWLLNRAPLPGAFQRSASYHPN